MPSIWESQSFYRPTDLCIIGAGLTGLFTAIEVKLRFPKRTVRILERGIIPQGASSRNAGFACFGSPSEILDDTLKNGIDEALALVIERYQGLERLRSHLVGFCIGWEDFGGYEIFTDQEKAIALQSFAAVDDINAQLQKHLGFAPYTRVANSFGLNTSFDLIQIAGEASIHSGKLLQALFHKVQSMGIEVLSGFEVVEVMSTGNGFDITGKDHTKLSAFQVVLATNAFTRKLAPDAEVYPNRGQILLTEPIPGLKLRGNYHLHQGYYYFRAYEGGIMLGGGRHLYREDERTESTAVSASIQDNLEQILATTIIPEQPFKIKQRWAGTMAFGSNNEKQALVEEISPGLFTAVRLGGMGVAMSSQVAKRVAALLD